MPFYQRLDGKNTKDRRTIEGLLRLREGLEAEIPQRSLKETLLLATWNIRDFDKPTYGYRLQESIHYIAEIISRFDLVAVQEVYSDLAGLERVMKVLGGNWKYICTDTTEGSHGNNERMAFIYDTRKVRFGGLAGELVLPQEKTNNNAGESVGQIWRTPFVCGFKAGWTKFMLSTVHVVWGEDNAESTERIAEIKKIAGFLKKRSEDKNSWSQNVILLGDFNIFNPDNATFQELVKAKFVIPEQLQQLPSNAMRVRHYDQIAFKRRKNQLDMTGKAGVFDYYRHVFRIDEETTYLPDMRPGFETKKDGKPRSDRSKKNYYKTYWRTHQMSDHLPMWIELKIDYSDEYLLKKIAG